MDSTVLQSLDFVSGMICHRPCVHHPAHSDCFKAHWRQYCFVQPTGHDLALLWLFRPL